MCEGCESKKVEIAGKARMYARVRNRIKKREGKAPQTTKAMEKTKLIEKTHEKHVVTGKCPLLTWGVT